MRAAVALFAMVCGAFDALGQTRGYAGCPEREGQIFASGAGIVEGFLPRDRALTLRMQTEMSLRARSHPDYVDNPRAVIIVAREFGVSREVALVPDGMEVKAGDSVVFDGAYWDPENSCRYIPNLIRAPATVG